MNKDLNKSNFKKQQPGLEPFSLRSEKLFSYILKTAIIGSILLITIQLFGGNTKEIFSGLTFLGVALVALYFNNNKNKHISYHLLVISVCLINMYMILFMGSRYHAILLMYPTLLIFCFIYFKQIRVLIAYLLFFIANQLVIIYLNAEAHLNGISEQVIAEFLNAVSFNVLIFLMCYFFLSNLRTAKQELEDATQLKNDQANLLKDKNKVLGQYIESNAKLESYTHLASHELKAPLRSVKSFVDLLKTKISAKLSEDESELFSVISNSTSKMSVLLDDLNTLGQVSQAPLNKEDIDPTLLFKEILLDRNSDIILKDVQVDIDIKFDQMIGQYSLLKQLFSNLIGNAIKFVEEGVRPVIGIVGEENKEDLIFRISDNGIGIPKEYRHRIFQIFERLHTEDSFKGSGIGLAICKTIVDLHKGSIQIEDSSLGGSCFVVVLPKLPLP